MSSFQSSTVMKKSESLKENQKSQRIQVFARCRPVNQYERKQGSPCVVDVNPERKEVKIQDDKMINKTFVFDKVFGPDTKQISVYKAVVGPLIREVLMGYNCTVFAYGQTGTGKTFTMEGERSSVSCSWEEDPNAGIIPRSLHQLFEELSKEENVEFSVHVSFLELYNEELFDLLSQNDISKLRLFEDGSRKGSVVIQGLEEIKVNSKDEVYVILEQGTSRRQKASTLLNATSSRSHTVFSVTVHIKENTIDGEELLKTGKLNLVDLAGSENIGRSGASQKTAREAGSINQSLLTLGRVITALVEKAPHIPYRESKLTRLLQDSLGGHTKTSIIATVSPALCNIEETISTLDYAQRAKNITIKPEVNQKMTKKALIKEYTAEIEKLRKDLVALRTSTGFYIDMENYNIMLQEIATKSNQIAELETKLEIITVETEKIEGMFKETQDKLQATTLQLDCTSKKYTITAEKLSKTKKELKCTKKVLDETILEKSKAEYINEVQDKTEKELFQQAQALLQAAEESSSHVSALHSKIERKQIVENANEERSQLFRYEFQKELAKLDDIMTSMVGDQEETLDALQTDIDGTLCLWSDRTTSVISMLKDFIALQDQHLNSFSLFYKSATESHVDWCDKNIQAAVEQKHAELEMQQNFLKNMFSLLRESSLSQLASLENQLRTSKESMCSKIESHKTAIKSAVSTHQQLISNLGNALETFSTRQRTTFLNAQEQASSIIHDNQIFSQKWSDDVKSLKEKIQSLDSFVDDYNSQLVSSVSKLNTDFGDVLCISDANEMEIKDQLRMLTEAEDLFQNDSVEFLKNLKTYQNGGLEQAEQVVKSLVDKQEDIEGQICDFLDRSKSSQERNLIMTTSIMDSEKEKSVEQLNECDERLKKLKSLVQSFVQKKENELEEHDNLFKVHINNHGKLLNDAKEQLFDKTKTLKEGLFKRDIDIEKFVSEVLLKDIPTGNTPQRKNYDFPRKLVPIIPQEEIIEEFRSQMEGGKAAALDQSHGSSSDENLNLEEMKKMQSKAPTMTLLDEESCNESDSSVSSCSDVSYKGGKNKENWPIPPSIIPKRILGAERKKKKEGKKDNSKCLQNSSMPQRLPLFSSNENVCGDK